MHVMVAFFFSVGAFVLAGRGLGLSNFLLGLPRTVVSVFWC
jgi:hypothetical protein